MATTIEETGTTTELIGARVRRVEDPRLLRGEARYLDDLKLPGAAHVAILRSPYAHARIRSIDTDRAAAAPGVVAVFTGRDFEHLNPLPCAWQAAGVDNFVVTPRALEIDHVTFTGAGVAAIVAETREAAEDALALIDVDWEPLEPVVDVERAVSGGGAADPRGRRPQRRLRMVGRRRRGGRERARRRRRRRRAAARQPAPDPDADRGARRGGAVRAGLGRLHGLDDVAGAARDAPPDDRVRVRDRRDEDARDRAAGRRRLRVEDLPLPRVRARRGARGEGRPARSSGSRRGARTTSRRRTAATTSRTCGSGRSRTARSSGSTCGRSRTSAASCSTVAGGIPTTLYARVLSGAYRIPAIHCHVTGVYTNTGMVDAYRGAGRPEATYVLERAVDLVARRLGLDPADVRRRNFIPSDEFPYDPGILNGLAYDTGDYEQALDRALELVGYDDFRAEQADGARARAATSASGSRATSRCAGSRRRSGSARAARGGARRSGRARTSAST